MKTSLVTFGCSFTGYCWPTWADWLSVYYGDFLNVAVPGSGNRAIYHKLVKYLNSKVDFSKEQIIIQWSSCVREDKYLKGDDLTYLSCGNITNTPYYTKEYISNHFSFQQELVETTNYIYSAKKLLELYNIKYLMTFMLDPRIGPHLGEPGFNINYEYLSRSSILKLKPTFERLSSYVDNTFLKSCITLHQLDSVEKVYSYSDENGIPQVDTHPGPLQHYKYTVEYILPQLQYIEPKVTKKLLENIEEWSKYAKIEQDREAKYRYKPNIWPTKSLLN